ncbi:MAG: XdhC family protein [Pseudomonadota bacterium]
MRDISEHPRDILEFAAASISTGHRCVLVVIADIEGPSARAVGAMMAVCDAGEYAGYVSNGCVDADIARQALSALHDRELKRVRYGAGSPFLDIRLPCGGAVEVVFVPDPDADAIENAIDRLNRRKPVTLSVNEDGRLSVEDNPAPNVKDLSFTYAPPLQIAIAGRGEETIALARLATAARYHVMVHSPDMDVLEACAYPNVTCHQLRSISDIPQFPDDPWTAIICLFHDHEWETDLLSAALETSAFYIGAMGSRKTQELRLAELRERGVEDHALQRLRGPIGLVPSVRDASKLGISALAEVVDLYRPQPT